MQMVVQVELAGRVGVSRQALSVVEAGNQDTCLPVALKIARTLNFPLTKSQTESIVDAGI